MVKQLIQFFENINFTRIRDQIEFSVSTYGPFSKVKGNKDSQNFECRIDNC